MQTPNTKAGLPRTRRVRPTGDLGLSTGLSIAICTLTAAASAAGIVATEAIYPSTHLVEAFLPNDVVTLLIGLPILIASLWLARTGKLVGLLLWPGALLYIQYNFLNYLLAMPLNAAFLLHLLLVALGWAALAALVGAIDRAALARRLEGHVSERLAGGVLTAFGVLFALRAIVTLVATVASGGRLPRTDIAVHAADTLVSPAWILGGVLLWRRRPLGYAVGLGLLFQATMLFLALIVLLLLRPAMIDVPLAFVDILVVAAMSLVCVVPLVRFLRGVTAASR